MEQFASKLVERVTDFVLDASIRQVCYIIRYKRRAEELKKDVGDLKDARERTEHQVVDAENNIKKIEADVRKLCESVDEKINESEAFSKEFEDDKAKVNPKTGCSSGILPFLWHRHRMGRKATKLADEVKFLKAKLSLDGVAYQENPKYANIAIDGYYEFRSRKKTRDEIMEKLKDSSVRMIGVYGPGGVGKSTLVKAIAKEARDNKLFDVVVIVEITRNPSRQTVQYDIAYPLGLTFERESENVRADRLRSRLLQKRESTLLILDDLWDGLDLNMLGIPFGDDDLGQMTIKDRNDIEGKMAGKEEQPSGNDDETTKNRDFQNRDSPGVYKGCKILLTSRIRDVLSDRMNVKEDYIFEVKELDDEEAVDLFKEMQGDNSKFKSDIVKRYCGGLPIAIITFGRALRNKSESEWDDVAKKISGQELMGVQKSIEISVKMSYDHLENEELKSIFLVCAQMAHQPLIMDLAKYCFCLDTLKGVHTLRDACDRISDSIKKLRNSSLMLDSNSSDHFKMHDMVRDAALSIAHKDQNVFTWRNDKLNFWPNKNELERCTVISIYKSDIVEDLPQVIKCQQLSVFHIDSDDPSLNIPDRFFEGMEELRVLILIGIRQLPSSIKCLSNLRMLCLERCELDNLSVIGDMRKLRVLSLSGSKIEDWSAGLGGLSKVQLLDVSDCSIGNMIPPNFISSMTSLEELYIGESLIKTKVEGETKQTQISVLSELKHLHQLKSIDVCFPSAEVLPTDVLFDKLNDYKIVIGDLKMLSVGDFKMPNKYEASRSLTLQLTVGGTDIQSIQGIKMLFKRVQNLLLGELNGVQNVFYELNWDGFPDLKHLSIINDYDIEYIVNSMELSHPQDAFPSLESLSLFNLMNLKMICCSLVTDLSFSRLKTIKVKMCSKLKNLLSFYLVKFLTSVETIDVSECDQLEEIVVAEEGEVSDKVEFRQLLSLTLQDLPCFISFYTINKIFSAPQCMASQARLTQIIPAENVQSCLSSLFGEKQVEMPKLETLKLSSINVSKIWSSQLSSFCFQNLIKLTVENCRKLTYLCSVSVASNLKKLKGLFVSNCPMMETLFISEGNSSNYSEVCIFPELEEIQLNCMDMLKHIWPLEVGANSFRSLVSMHIERCNKLDKIFPSDMQCWHKSLESLKVLWCVSVQVIFEIRCPLQKNARGADTKLQFILLKNLNKLKHVWSGDPEGVFNFTNMRRISVSFCGKLRNVMPASIAKGMEKLEDLTIVFCDEMVEVVKWVEGSETSNEPLMFAKVTSMKFITLPQVRCFYMGSHTIECPNLKRLEVLGCPALETFTTKSADEEGIRPAVFSTEKVISNLEYLRIDSKQAKKWLKSNIGKYRMRRLKELCLQSLPSVEILYWFLHRIPNLEMLNLNFRSSEIRELVPSGNTAPQQRLGFVLQLKELTLREAQIEDIVFESELVLQRLERLRLFSCYKLTSLTQSSVSLTHLTYLEVSSCDRLKNLMAPSTAKSLVQLTTMKVRYCRALKEIVSSELGNEQETVVDSTIVFPKLITIELRFLNKLTSFCSNNKCEFCFPSLEKLILRRCSNMKTFTESDISAPKLQSILAAKEEEEEKVYWGGDLNGTIRKVFDKDSLEYASRLELSRFQKLKQVWCGEDLVHMQHNWFGNLKVLVVKGCDYLMYVIPSHLVHCFNNLEELEVDDCCEVQVIFNLINIDTGRTRPSAMFRLKRLSLRNLPKLEHVWDKDPQGTIGVQALQYVSIF